MKKIPVIISLCIFFKKGFADMRGVWTVSGFCFDAVCGRFGESTDRGGVFMAALVELLALVSVNFSRLTIMVLLFSQLSE